MCVMDFAGEGNTPMDDNMMQNNKNDINIRMNKEDMMNNSNFANNQNYNMNNPNNQSPLVKLSLENDDMKNNLQNQAMLMSNNNNLGNNNQQIDEIGQLTLNTLNALNSLKVVNKKVEINTKVTYTYEDGSTRTVNSVETHEFK